MPNPFIDSAEELTSGTAECEAVASNQPPLPGATAEPISSSGEDVPAAMQGSNDCGLARDDLKPGATMQESRSAHLATAPLGITTVTHNPVTHAVEVRPSSGSIVEGHEPQHPQDRHPLAGTQRAGVEPGLPEATDCIGEIFVGARRLPQRELPPDFHARLLEAIESDEIWAAEPPLFLRKPL